jgi:hypothetical protein
LVKTPDDIKQMLGSGPIAQIPPTDTERMGSGSPLYASTFNNKKLFPDHQSTQKSGVTQSNLKPPPVASLKNADSSVFSEQELVEEIFGEDAKPPAKNPYNLAARVLPNYNNRILVSLIEAEASEKATAFVRHSEDQISVVNKPSQVTDMEMHINSDLDPVEELN